MATSSQTALLQLIEAYLQDLRREAETLSTVARLLNRSIEERRAVMAELDAYFTNRQAAPVVGPGVHGHPAWSGVPPVAAPSHRTDELLRDLDAMMSQSKPRTGQWPNGYHA